MPSQVATSPEAEKHRNWQLAVAVACIAPVLVGTTIFFGLGHWLVTEDALEKAQAIVVLNGGIPVRAEEAARLFNAGYAPQVWLTRTNQPAAALQEMHIAYIGEDFYDARVLMQQGVPSNAIRVLDQPIDNTADEIRRIAGELDREKGTAVIIVTSKVHTRRVRTLWKDLASRRGRAIVRGATNDPFDPSHWWRSTGDALDVVRESLGLMNAWAGLPLEPSR